ncbi:hypothetical protein NMG60_11036990 [Bertholletia excelsa]
MDLKSKGRTWVVNFYEKFEAMCQEVDDIVTQDAVKYVEGQVHTVGKTVKRFCSDVMQDILPPSLVEPGEQEAQAVSMKQNNTVETYITTMMGAEEKSLYADISHSSVEKKPIDAIKSGCEQVIHQPSADCFKEDNLNGDNFRKSDVIEENNKMEELIDKMSNDVFEEDDHNGESSWPEVLKLDLVSSEHQDLPQASLLSESMNERYENGMHTEVSPATSTHHNQKDSRVCGSFFDEPECISDASHMPLFSHMPSAVVSIENKAAEDGLISSTSSLQTETYNPLELALSNVSQNKENICNYPVDHDCVSGLSCILSPSQQFPMLSCESVVSLESNDADTSITNDTSSLVESSGNRNEHCYECIQQQALPPSFEIDNSRIDIACDSMESIQLSDKAIVDGRYVVDSKLLSTVTLRPRSYKKILKDAITYKRRIRKEYEQLAIMYGDIDIEPSKQPHKNLSPCTHPSSVNLEKSSLHDSWGLEWELL